MDKASFRLRLKGQDNSTSGGFIVYKRKRSGSYIPGKESSKVRKKSVNNGDDIRYFDGVPDELCVRIYYFLSAKDLCQGPSQVCKRLHILSEYSPLWKEYLSRELSFLSPLPSTQKTNWKSYFIKSYKRHNCPLQLYALQYSQIFERQLTCIDQNNTISTAIVPLIDLDRFKFDDIFTKRLKWDIYITIGISVKPLDTKALLHHLEFSQDLPKVHQLRKYLEQAWRHQKYVQSIIKLNLKAHGWTILDTCSRRNLNSERTIPKTASIYFLSARVHRWDTLSKSSVVFINYPMEEFSKDFNLLKTKFSERKKKQT